jgi:hypothetical protein
MVTIQRRHLVPESHRRTLEELSSDLELRTGDATKRSRFWTMLALSAVIAAAGGG